MFRGIRHWSTVRDQTRAPYTSFTAALSATQAMRASRPVPPAIAADDAIEVLFSDKHLVCLSKPTGLLSVPGHASSDNLKSRVRARPRFNTAEPVHRLDKCTSGVMLMALDAQSCSALGRQFAQRTVRKRYIAIVDGVLDRDSGRIALPIRATANHRPLRAIADVGEPGAKACATTWQVVARSAGSTRVLLSPTTGRSHQLRLHMAAIGHPIIGDVMYAIEETTLAKSQRLLLHASELTVAHPASNVTMAFRAPCPF